jgi:tetratricopeptide (TPR) repeat protein
MPRLSNRRSTFNILPLLVLLLTIIIVIFGLVRGFSNFKQNLLSREPRQELPELWENNDFSEILYLTESQLEKDPFDGEALFFNGAASFYMAISMVSLEDKLNYLQKSIISFRRHLLSEHIYYEKETYYLLGKCYVQSGPYYSDLALKYLLKARDLGYDNSDLSEYLALAYSRLGDFELSIRYLSSMAEKNPTPSLLLRMGEDAFNMGRYELSRDFLIHAVEISQNEPIRLEAFLKLGELYFAVKNWDEAEKVLSQYLEIDYNDADVHFMLGEVYFNLGDNASARMEWHRTERIDPHHRDALLRLYN